MSINFSQLEYCSLYGSNYLYAGEQGTLNISGSLAAYGSAAGTQTFRFKGLEGNGSPGDPDYVRPVTLERPALHFYVSGDTPNTLGEWHEVNNEPRPLAFPTSGGNINMNVIKYREAPTTAEPMNFVFKFVLNNIYAGSVTFDYDINYRLFLEAIT